jgi:hypothetical protein
VGGLLVLRLVGLFNVGTVARRMADNVQVFMKKVGFENRQLVIGAGFCSKVELLPTAS